MLEVDFHSHSMFSLCGVHTHIEMLSHAKSIGMAGLAITDHGPLLDSKIPSPFFDRLQDPVPGIRLLKGMECNISDEEGEIDAPRQYIANLDVVLLGLHQTIEQGRDSSYYTKLIKKALLKNPCVDIISHPNESGFPLDFEALADFASQLGVALELNNSKTLYRRAPDERTMELIYACKKSHCSVVMASDAHVLHEIGLNDSIVKFIGQADFPSSLLVNDTKEKAFDFIRSRRAGKIAPYKRLS